MKSVTLVHVITLGTINNVYRYWYNGGRCSSLEEQR